MKSKGQRSKVKGQKVGAIGRFLPFAFCLLTFAFPTSGRATTVTGRIEDTAGNAVTGTLQLQLTQEAVSTEPALIVNSIVTCAVTNGAIGTCVVLGNDVLSPAGTRYWVRALSTTSGEVLPRRRYNITGATWDIGTATPDASDVTVASAYQIVQEEGANLMQRAKLNFIGAGATCVDNSGAARTDCTITAGGGSVPTGTGFRHVTAGVEDAAAKLAENADVAAGAAIVESKLALNFATHSNANDPTADQKAALAGTSGAPSVTNKYVTDADARNTNARTPSAHVLANTTGLGGEHTTSGLTAGQVLRASAATAAAFAAIQDGDLPATIARDSELSHEILSATHTDALTGSVILGDTVHGNATPKWARLAGNITTTKQYLSQTGTGAASAVPAWSQPAFSELAGSATAGQVPNLESLNGTLDVSSGGTGAAPGAGDQVVISDSTTGATWRAIPACNTVTEKTFYNTGTNTWTCEADAGAGGGAPVGAQYVVGASDATLTAEKILTDGTGIDTVLTGTDAGAATLNLEYAKTLAGNPAFNVKECIFTVEGTSGGGFLCEGTIANTNEQLYLFPALDGVDTTTFIALGAPDGDALAGDSATSFFDTGNLELARLPFGTANQILGTNAGATAIEHKTLSTGTTGTDFAVAHAANSIAFNLPDASATARGALTSANWSTFNNSVDSVSGTTNQIGSTGGQTPVLSLADPLTFPGNLIGTQKANGDTFFQVTRFTDTTPTGNFLNLRNAAGGTLWKVDITGAQTSGSATDAGIHTLGGASSTTPSVFTMFGGDGAANAEPPYIRGIASPVASGANSFLFPCSTAGEWGIAATTAPSANCTSAQTIERIGRKDAASGYAGLTASTKLNAAQGQEVWSVTDLTSYATSSGTGTQAIFSTITTPSSNDVLTWNGTNWINQAPGGSSHNFLSATHTDTVAGASVLGGMVYANATPAWAQLAGNITTTKKFLNQTGNATISAAPQWDAIADADVPAAIARDSEITLTNLLGGTAGANSYDFAAASMLRTRTAAGVPAAAGCDAAGEVGSIYARSDANAVNATHYVCSQTSVTPTFAWELTQGAAGGGDNISVNGVAATNADFDDATPAAGAGYQNVNWQKDALDPTNISAELPFATGSLAGTVSTTSQTFAGDKAIVHTGADIRALLVDASGSSLNNSGAFIVKLPATGLRKGFQIITGADAISWASFEWSAGGTDKPGFALGPGGAAARDTNIYRDAANSLKTDDAFTAAVSVTSPIVNATTGFQVNSAATTAKCLLGNGTNFVQSTSDCLTTDSTATLTGKTYDAEGTGNTLTLTSEATLDGAGCIAGTAALNWDTPAGDASAAPTAACNDTGSIQRPSADFAGGAVNSFERTIHLPTGWTGNIDLTIHYVTVAATPTGNVEWEVQTICRAAGETWDAAFNAAQTITDAVAAQNVINVATQAALTTTTCAADEDFSLRIWRDGLNDTNNDLAKFLHARLVLRRAL